MNKKVRYLIIGLAAVVALVLIQRLFFSSSEKIDYLTEKVRIGKIEQKVIATGEVAAAQLVTVGAQVSGQIKKLHVHLGQEVKKGDLVAEIDSTTQENDLNINKAKLETYKAQLNSRQIALKIAQTQYNREAGLKSKDATSRENFENAENALAQAKADVTETQSLVVQTQIAVSTAEVNLGYTRIMAPLDGTLVSIPVEEGQTVNANQTTPTIALIADLREMEIKIQISEGDVTKVAPGMEVTYSILSEPGMVFTGKLRSIDPGLTTLTDGTYAGAVDAASAIYYYGKMIVPNPEGKLRIGMTTQNVILLKSADNVLIVPTLALQGQGAFVRVLEKTGKVVEKDVVTGLADSMNTEIISGLQKGDLVILSQMTADEIDASAASSPGRRRPRM